MGKLDIDKFIPKGSEKLIDPLEFLKEVYNIRDNVEESLKKAKNHLKDVKKPFDQVDVTKNLKLLEQRVERLEESIIELIKH